MSERGIGVAHLGTLIDDQQELAWLRDRVDRLVASVSDADQDLVRSQVGGQPLTQVLAPTRLDPELASTGLVERARDVIVGHLGRPVDVALGMVLCKPALHGGVVPWHQDGVYWDAADRAGAGTIWVALQDVDVANGGVQFIPRRHGEPEILEHRPLAGDPTGHGVELTPDEVHARVIGVVDLRLRAGEASFHDGYVVHGSGPNTTDDARRALVLSVRPA